MMDDLELLRVYAERGSEQAFADLVGRHANLVYSTALRYVRDADLARDVVQMVFRDLACKAKKLCGGTVVTGWLYRSTRYAASTVLRTERRRRKRETFAMEIIENNSDTQSVWTELAPLLEDAMNRLGKADQDAVLLRFFEGKSLRDVGQALGMTDDAAQKRLARALEKLRSFFAAKGVKVSVTFLVPAIAANAVQAAPEGLTPSVVATSLAGATGAGASSLVTTLVTIMSMTKLKMAALALLLAVAVTVPIASGIFVWRYLAGGSAKPQAKMIKADDILPYITPGPGGIPVALLGQQELSAGRDDGEHDPAAAPGEPGCYGLAWLVKGYSNAVVVFQDKRELQFEPGGWYSQIRLPDNIRIAAEDIGRIQAEWLQKTYGGAWTVQVLR